MNLFIFHYLYFLSLNIIITSQFFIKLIYLTNIFDLSVESFVETNPIIKLSLLVKKKVIIKYLEKNLMHYLIILLLMVE